MELVAAICRTGSVTQAAEACGLTQPGASAMLKELEVRIGAALFSRRHRHLELTAAGQAVLPEITHALAALDAVDKLAQSLGNRRGEHLIIGTVSATGASVLPAVLKELQDADPMLSVVLRVGTAAEVVEMAIEQRTIWASFLALVRISMPTLNRSGSLAWSAWCVLTTHGPRCRRSPWTC